MVEHTPGLAAMLFRGSDFEGAHFTDLLAGAAEDPQTKVASFCYYMGRWGLSRDPVLQAHIIRGHMRVSRGYTIR